jgi:hypothetical protein
MMTNGGPEYRLTLLGVVLLSLHPSNQLVLPVNLPAAVLT